MVDEQKLKEMALALIEVVDAFEKEINDLKKRVADLEKRGTDIQSVRFV